MARSNQTSHSELYAEWHGGYMHANDMRLSTGRRLYVSSLLGGTAGGDGDSPENPLSTIQGAIDLAVDADYDQIVVMPGHTEDLTAAADITTAGVSGIRIVGVGNGEDRPRLNFTEALATITIGSANVTFENLIFVTGIDSVASMLTVLSTNFHLKDCEFRNGSALETLIYVTVGGGGANAADGFHMEGCRMFSPVAGNTHGVALTEVNDRIVIEDNFLCMDSTVGPIWSDQILTNVTVRDNIVHSLSTGICAVLFSAAATGQIVDNHLYGDTLGTILDPGSCVCCGNLEVDAIDQAAIPTPATAAGPFLVNAFDAGSIAADTLTADKIAGNAIAAAEIANNAFTGAKFANDVGVWRKAISDYDFDTDTGAQASYTVFTVTGDVVVRCVATCGAAITTGGVAPTIELGVVGNTACLIAQVADGRNLILNEIWHDATPTTTCEIVDLPTTHNCILSNGQDIAFLIGGANLTAGHIDFYCLWYPLSADGNVVAA